MKFWIGLILGPTGKVVGSVDGVIDVLVIPLKDGMVDS
jgi:hypothetical protein